MPRRVSSSWSSSEWCARGRAPPCSFQRHALVAQLEHPLGHEGGLLVACPGWAPAPAWGPRARAELSSLGNWRRLQRDGGVGQREDLRRRAVVAGEPVDAAARVARGELDDVGEVRAAEAVDGLRVVAHHREVAALAASRSTRSPCSRLVSWYSSTSTHWNRSCSSARTLGVLEQQPLEQHQQVVEVHQVHARCLRSAKRRVTARISSVSGRNCGRRSTSTSATELLGVDGHGDEVQHHLGLGEAPRVPGQLALGDAGGHQVARVLAVQQREVARRSRAPPRAGAAARAPTWWKVPPSERRTSAKAPASSSTRRVISRAALLVKVSSSMRLGRNAPLEHPRHPEGQRARLARARPGDDQRRPRPRLHHRAAARR